MTSIDSSAKNSRAGFSLIELAVASALILFFILGAGQMILRCFLSKQRSDLVQVSAGLASDKLESLKSEPFDAPDLTGSHEETVAGGNPPKAYLRRWEVMDDSPSLKKIIIECFPLGRPGRKTRVALYVSQILGF